MTHIKGEHFKGDFHSCGGGMSMIKGKNVNWDIDLQITKKTLERFSRTTRTRDISDI